MARHQPRRLVPFLRLNRPTVIRNWTPGQRYLPAHGGHVEPRGSRIDGGADFTQIWNNPGVLTMDAMWMLIHVVVLLGVGWLIRAPIFFVAVGSRVNIGEAATSPVVASAFHLSLAPVGALLAVAGYVLGTYYGLLCMNLLKIVAGV